MPARNRRPRFPNPASRLTPSTYWLSVRPVAHAPKRGWGVSATRAGGGVEERGGSAPETPARTRGAGFPTPPPGVAAAAVVPRGRARAPPGNPPPASDRQLVAPRLPAVRAEV